MPFCEIRYIAVFKQDGISTDDIMFTWLLHELTLHIELLVGDVWDFQTYNNLPFHS